MSESNVLVEAIRVFLGYPKIHDAIVEYIKAQIPAPKEEWATVYRRMGNEVRIYHQDHNLYSDMETDTECVLNALTIFNSAGRVGRIHWTLCHPRAREYGYPYSAIHLADDVFSALDSSVVIDRVYADWDKYMAIFRERTLPTNEQEVAP